MPITMAAPLSFLGHDPAYIRVMPSTLASLPKIAPRVITGLPEGRDAIVYDAPDGTSCRIGAAHYGSMATVTLNNGAQLFGVGDQNINPGAHMRRWYFHGIHWQCAQPTQSYFMWMTGDQSSGQGIVLMPYYGADPTAPDHVMFNQCAFEGDTAVDGHGGTILAWFEGTYLGLMNSYVDKFYGPPGSENRLWSLMNDTWGPLQIENNEFPTPAAATFFTGGGSSLAVGVNMQDNTFNRNWCPTPVAWRPSEVNPMTNPFGATWPGWYVSFTATDAFTAHFASGSYQNVGGFGGGVGYQYKPARQCIMWEPTTGKARRIVSAPDDDFGTDDALSTSVTLASAWPGAGTGTPLTIGPVYFHMPYPNCVLNTGTLGSDFSGYTDVPRATVSNGSTAVSFTLNGVGWALPADVRVGHYFHLTNLHWDGGGLNGSWPDAAHRSATDTSYGYRVGVTKAQCRRQKIVAIAGDRKSCTLEYGYTVLGGEPTTFPFCVVTWDGLFRDSYAVGKNCWETKCAANRMEMRGNVLEWTNGNGTMHLVRNNGKYNQAEWGAYTFSTVGDLGTASSGIYYLPHLMSGLRASFNHNGYAYNGAEVPWPYSVVAPRDNMDGWGNGRVILHYTDATHFVMEPQTHINPATGFWYDVTNGPYSVCVQNSPWWTNRGFNYSYNVLLSNSGGFSMRQNNEDDGEITKGKWYNVHDNVFLLTGDTSQNQGGTHHLGPMMCGGAGPTPTDLWTSNFGSTTQETSYLRWSHNTYAHATLRPSSQSEFAQIYFSDANVKGHDLELANNIVAGWNAGTIFTTTGYASVNPNRVWALDETCVFARNIFAGPGAPSSLADPNVTTHFSENAGLTSYTGVGFVNYDAVDSSVLSTALAAAIQNGDVNPLDFSPYALTDIYSTGTVAISGATITLDSGTFPSVVQAGQYFTRTAGGVPIRIQSVGSGGTTGSLSASWQTYSGWTALTLVNGRARNTSAGGRGVMSHTGTLPGDQWVQATVATIVEGNNSVGVWLRLATPQTRSGYLFTIGFGGASIYRCDAGAFTQIGSAAYSLAPNQVLRFEAHGTALTGYIDDVAIVGPIPDGTHAGGRGALDFYTPADVTQAELTAYLAGDFSGGGGSRVTLASDAFGVTGATSLTLASAYPAGQGTSGNAYAITFKGTATDGTDPGANLSLVEQFTRNVRTRAIA